MNVIKDRNNNVSLNVKNVTLLIASIKNVRHDAFVLIKDGAMETNSTGAEYFSRQIYGGR